MVTEQKLHKRSDLHLARKLFHISTGALFLYFFAVLQVSPIDCAAALTICLGFVVAIELFRKNNEAFNRWMVLLNRGIIREEEQEGWSGVSYYLSSCIFAVVIFPYPIAVLAILYLVLGDPSSSFFGVTLGKDKLFPNKSLQGTLGGFFVCSLATFVYLTMTGFHQGNLLILVVLGGLIGAISEMLPLGVDDNFSIPLVSGFLLWFTFWAADMPLSGALALAQY